MVTVCNGCRGPAVEVDVTVGSNTVTIVQCPECDMPRCPTCAVPVPHKHAQRCPQGHRL